MSYLKHYPFSEKRSRSWRGTKILAPW
uniref:Uncharacterized protein n=1 Tax=Oryza nivara TaxID=4536 RepID=A0A0E0GHZ6_ORYNI